jgi:zinc transport system substrate-binding protein
VVAEPAGILAEELHLSSIGGQEPEQEAEQGGLAGAVRADQGDELAGRDVEGDVVDHRLLAVREREAYGGEGDCIEDDSQSNVRGVGRTAAAIAFAVALGACGNGGSSNDDEVSVVASFYPLAFLAEEVGGAGVDVANLTPTGAEPHDIELTPDQVDEILDADVALVMGEDFQPAIEEAVEDRDGPTVLVLDELPIDGEDPARDPHVWLDPVLMGEMTVAITDALIEADPDHADAYERRARALERRLDVLHAKFEDGLSDCDRDTIVTAHDAFGYLADRYALAQEPIAGISPDEEPSPERLAELSDLAEDLGVTTIFTESLVSPEIAETLAREAGGLETAVLNPLEGLTEEEIDADDDYISVMEANLEELRGALGCR